MSWQIGRASCRGRVSRRALVDYGNVGDEKGGGRPAPPALPPPPPLAGLVGRILEVLGDELADEAHLLLAHPPGGHRRRPDADAAGHRPRLPITRHGILVYRGPRR